MIYVRMLRVTEDAGKKWKSRWDCLGKQTKRRHKLVKSVVQPGMIKLMYYSINGVKGAEIRMMILSSKTRWGMVEQARCGG